MKTMKTIKSTFFYSIPKEYFEWNKCLVHHLEEHYPAVWLRDNCQCPKCYQASALARLHLMRNVDPEIKFKSSELASNNEVCLYYAASISI